ncbi:MAG TPA: glycoside hydrolase family 3 N-terminal domain-containing protein [Chloroflexia bacterium]|nr:glycoside hydrolase family 3 N-terminal domain-containing protein [Chloroflexia bacterium]
MIADRSEPATLAAAKGLNLAQKVGQLLLVEIPGVTLTAETATFLAECHPAGVALFGQNLAGPWATRRLIAALQDAAAAAGDAPLLVGIDQEGGQVARLRYPHAELPSNMAVAAAGGPAAAGEAAEILGREMALLGINLAFAPVVDVNTEPLNPVIGTRAYGDDPAEVAACAVAAVEGLRRGGVFSMAKHFPGHGDTRADSHLARPVVAHGAARLAAVELVPFRAAIAVGVDTICSAHVGYPGVDSSGLLATLSPTLMTTLLRDELGFRGTLFADALVMDAIAGKDSANIPPAAVQAVQAGVDCLMVLGSLALQRRCHEALMAAVEDGTIPMARLDEAVGRVQALRERIPPLPPPVAWPVTAHQAASARLARAAVTCVRDRDSLLPLEGPGVGLIELVSGGVSPVESARNEPLGGSTLAMLVGQRFPDLRCMAVDATAPDAAAMLDAFVAGCTRLIVATRSAVLNPAQAPLLQRIGDAGRPVIHLALRSPYDAMLAPAIGTVLLTYGDPPPALTAVVDVLLGTAPAGRLPVRLPDLTGARTGSAA